jgi:hypothetical protein
MSMNAFPALPLIVPVMPLVQLNLAELQTKTEAEQKQSLGEVIYPFIQ